MSLFWVENVMIIYRFSYVQSFKTINASQKLNIQINEFHFKACTVFMWDVDVGNFNVNRWNYSTYSRCNFILDNSLQ